MTICTESDVYGDHPRQTVTVHYQPVEPIPCGRPTPRAGLVMIHGGSWAHKRGMGEWPTRFAESGYVVFEIGYRLNGDAPWPAQRDDVTAALVWTRGNAHRWNADPSVIGVLGSSAGGHLAACLGVTGHTTPPQPLLGPSVQVGYDDTDPTRRTVAASVDNRRTAAAVAPPVPPLHGVRCVVALSAPLDPERAWRDGEHPSGTWAKAKAALRVQAEKLAGGRPDDDPAVSAVWDDLAVRTHAAGAKDAPVLAIHFADDMVPVAHATDLHDAEVGQPDPGQVLVVELPGQGHGLITLAQPGILGSVQAFLAEHLATNQGPLPPTPETPMPETPGAPSCPSTPEPGPCVPDGCCGGGTCGGPADSDGGPAPLPDPTMPPAPAPAESCCGGAPCGGPGQSDPAPVPPPPCVPEHSPCGGQGSCDGGEAPEVPPCAPAPVPCSGGEPDRGPVDGACCG